MKIEIELNSSNDAAITIGGRELTYALIGKTDGLRGLTDEERDGTIAGIVASRLADVLPDILQGFIPDATKPEGISFEDWEILPDAVANQVYKDVNGF